MRTMTPRERIAQLIVIGFSGHPMNTRTREYRKFVHLVSQEHVGGLILVNVSNGRTVAKADPLEAASFINRMQRLAKIPLLVSADFERGASMRVDATTVFPHAMAFTASRDPNEARIEGEITAREARALGVQWLFFPGCRRQQQSGQPDHQYSLLRRESGRCVGVRFRIHYGRALGCRTRAC